MKDYASYIPLIFVNWKVISKLVLFEFFLDFLADEISFITYIKVDVMLLIALFKYLFYSRNVLIMSWILNKATHNSCRPYEWHFIYFITINIIILISIKISVPIADLDTYLTVHIVLGIKKTFGGNSITHIYYAHM